MAEVVQLSDEIVEAAWIEVGGYDARRIAEEIQRVMDAQAELLSFVLDLTEDLSPQSHELAVYMALVIYRAYESAFPAGLRHASPREILRVQRANERWVEDVGRTHERLLAERVLPNLKFAQPAVLQYVSGCLFESDEGVPGMTDEDQSVVFFVMKAFIEVLDRCAGSGAERAPVSRKKRDSCSGLPLRAGGSVGEPCVSADSMRSMANSSGSGGGESSPGA